MPETFENYLQRSEILFGSGAMAKLARSRVLLAGAGGVGGYAAEALVRGGIGHLTVYDPDKVHPTNLNRQILALRSTNNMFKTDVLQERLHDINPGLDLQVKNAALTRENIPQIIDEGNFDCIIDAIDSINDKCFLLAYAYHKQIKTFSSMGAGCRVDPTKIQYADISKTHSCALAKNLRAKLKKEYNIVKGIECIFSCEINPAAVIPGAPGERPTIGSSSFIPGIFGLFAAAGAINYLKTEIR